MRCASNSPNEGAPVSVTLVKPAGADTLFVEHAKDHLDQQPKLPQPVYAPNVVARAILHATVRPPTRSLCRRRIARHGIVRTLGAARLRCHIEQARREGATHRRATAERRPTRSRRRKFAQTFGASWPGARTQFLYRCLHARRRPTHSAHRDCGIMLVAAAGRYLRETKGRRAATSWSGVRKADAMESRH